MRRVLVVAAHPDDETIFFGGSIRRLSETGSSVDVVCATGKFQSESATSERREEFRKACRALGIRGWLLDLPDIAGPLPSDRLESSLWQLLRRRSYDDVYTHGVLGEYGHPHHRSICVAVHRLFGTGVWSLAGPLPPDHCAELAADEYRNKRSMAGRIYRSQRIAAEWCSRTEAFVRLTDWDAIWLAGVCLGWKPLPARTATRDLAHQALARLSGAAFAEVAGIPERIWRPAAALSAARLRAALSTA